MKSSLPLLLAAALAPQTCWGDIVRHPEIPASLRGTWAPAGESCDADYRLRLDIAARAYTAANFKCSIDWVAETPGAKGPIYSAHLQCSSEENGIGPKPANILLIQNGPLQIMAGTSFTSLKPYQRC